MKTIALLSFCLLGMSAGSHNVSEGTDNAFLQGPACERTCSYKVTTKTTANANPGVYVTGCGLCIGVFSEMIDVTKGVCTGVGCITKGTCKGKLRVEISSVNSGCCQGTIGGGWKPGWGDGPYTPGSSAYHIFDESTAKCGANATTDWTLTFYDINNVATTQDLVSTMTCSDCDGEAPPAN